MKKELLEILDSIKGSGTFITSNTANFILPALQIEEVDELRFPVDEQQIRTLLTVSDQAPYGKGDQTVVNTEVRDVW